MAGAFGRPGWRVLWAGQFLTTAGLTVMVPFLPLYMEELGVRDAAAARMWSGLALAAPAVALSICAPLWGRLGDRWGRKWMVVRALLGLALSLVLMGLSTTPLSFLLCRLAQGVCGGLSDTTAAFVSAETPAEGRGRALGSLQQATALGALTGPLLAGPLIDLWGLRPLLILAGLLTAATAFLAALTLREGARRDTASSWKHPLRVAVLGLLSQRRTRAFLLAGLCTQAGIYGVVTAFAPHVRVILPDSDHIATWVGVLQGCAWAAAAVGAVWWGRRNDSAPLEQNFIAAALGCGASIAMQGAALSVGLLLPLRILQGFFLSALAQSVFLCVNREATSGKEGVHTGVANSFLTFGQIGGALAGGALASIVSLSWVFPLMGCLLAAGALLVRWSSERWIRLEGETAVR